MTSQHMPPHESKSNVAPSPRARAQKNIPALIDVDGDDLWTSSVVIAQEFERPHKNVLRDLDALIADGTLLRGLSFEPTSIDVIGPNGGARQERAIRLNERGFLIAMPFLGGRKSREGQVRLVDAFLKLRAQLRRNEKKQANAEWLQARSEGKVMRLALTDAVEEFVTYAEGQGSQNARKYYLNITMMEYRALFFVGKAVDQGFRDTLTMIQNIHLATAESIAQKSLRDGIARNIPYKEVYQLAKAQVEAFSAIIGRSPAGDNLLFLPRRKA